MKVMISIKPYWYYLIFIAKIKKAEIRKTMPKREDWDGDVIAYVSQDKASLKLIPEEYREQVRAIMGKVGGEFALNWIHKVLPRSYFYWAKEACLSLEEMNSYLKDKGGYALDVATPMQYDTPKELGEFNHICKGHKKLNGMWSYVCCALTRPFQSWGYCE